jgi:hypothetical protein
MESLTALIQSIAQSAKRADIGLDKHPGTLLEVFQNSSNIQAGRQPDTSANGLSR